MQIKASNSEIAILLIVSLMALTANLPDGTLIHIVNRNLLLVTLTATVFISLFRYLKLMLFLTVSVLAIGANLPDQLARQLGISQTAMIIASGVLVCVAILYKMYFLRILKKYGHNTQEAYEQKRDTIESRAEVIESIRNGDFASLHQLLMSGVEVNFRQEGDIPLFLAIENDFADLVVLLLSHGATLHGKNREGMSPLEFALLNKRIRIAEIIHYASRHSLTIPTSSGIFPASDKSKMVILFADICGSTALYDKLGNDSALHIIAHTLNILAKEVTTHKGTLIKTIGDEIMCSFPSIAQATLAANSMHRAIDAQQPGGKNPVFVRIGFHYGDVIHKGNDVFGDAVNVASRVTAVTRARQILTTQAVIKALPGGFADRVRPVMRAAFRGKQDSLALYQILWEENDTIFNRIGEPSFRKRVENNSDLPPSGNQVVQHYMHQIDETISMKEYPQTAPSE